ncbi:MAG: hypothetical protein SFX19_05325 [Alphaproteobacteria bacterium]|nr:hypothetical protein [Alphaproteobacteria bacterium]
MNKNLPTILTVSALALALGACTPEQRVHHKSGPGTYESTETNTDAKGTTTVKTSTTEVTIDEDGNRRETITSKTSRDPEGLGNKTSTKTKKTTEEKY